MGTKRARRPARAVGIDIGGTGMKAAVADLTTGELVTDRVRIPTPKGGRPKDMGPVVGRLIAMLGDEARDLPVGVGFPGPVVAGRIRSAANLDAGWTEIDGAAFLAEHAGRPVALGNDADVAGLAEMRFGAGAGLRGTVLMLTLGTGIGSALFVDGRLVPNTELGHMIVGRHEAEARASASAREREGLSWSKWAKRVARCVNAYQALLWPDLVILGGGVSKRAHDWLPHLEADVRVPLRIATLENRAGVVGAAVLAGEA
ncbi:MAG: ROK family protein [Thermoleophilia bacterium]|jgi:polyphosphate glucokinase|nr:ROK family protein [Thermoleophilia bacterium]